ncbi:MAG: EsaB/YukD family protein [Lachnospiraceae bacterium]|nr:EsaB/YukD family protein [Lachnospiraceae bacterium]MDO5551105.1 EsaB/YukD family protein [Lachnospiraceae bacterium]
MIMVDVTVPSIGRQYNFSLEEQAAISMLIAEITEVICQKECCQLAGSIEKLNLCSYEQKKILSPAATLSQYGITNGSRLLLV